MPHGFHPAEFVPAAPLLPVLGEVMGYAVAFGLCYVAVYFVKSLFGIGETAVGWIPWLGGKLKGDLKAVEQRLTNKLGEFVARMDHRMALAWYKLAHTAEWIGHEIMANSGVLLAIARTLEGLPGLVDWQAFIRKVRASLVWAEHHAIGAVHTITRPLTANVSALSRWTHSQIHALRHSIAVTIPGEFAGLRHRTRVLEDWRAKAWKFVKRHERLFGELAFAGLVARALAHLGGGWIRCAPFKNNAKRLCALDPRLIESLLTGALAIFGAISLVAFAHALLEVADDFVGSVTGWIREMHGVPQRSAAQQGFAATGGSVNFRTPQEQGFA